MFSWLARTWFRAPINDVHCGMRAFRRSYVASLELQCTGMEFASEMIIKAALRGGRVAEVPVTLHRDGRTLHPPHLRTFRDGWRHLRFYLMYSPRWLFLVPGLVLGMLGLIGYAVAMPGLRIGGVHFDVHTLLLSSLAIICGYQAILFAFQTKIFGETTGLLPSDPKLHRLFQLYNLERGLAAGAASVLAGVALLAAAVVHWWGGGFGPLDYLVTMRWVIPGVTLTVLGFQTVLASFFFSILGLAHR
jgi:hypothetical protein